MPEGNYGAAVPPFKRAAPSFEGPYAHKVYPGKYLRTLSTRLFREFSVLPLSTCTPPLLFLCNLFPHRSNFQVHRQQQRSGLDNWQRWRDHCRHKARVRLRDQVVTTPGIFPQHGRTCRHGARHYGAGNAYTRRGTGWVLALYASVCQT